MALNLKRFKSMLLAFCAATALVAQVDSKLATTTDLLDVYKNGGSTPELLTVFDFSGSMVNCFWHGKYWTDQNSDQGNQMTIDTGTGKVSLSIGNGVTASGFLVEPSGARITTTVWDEATVKRASHARLTATVTGTVATSSTQSSYSINNASTFKNNDIRYITYTTTTKNSIIIGDVVTVTGLVTIDWNVTSATVTNRTDTSFTVAVGAKPGFLSKSTGTVSVMHTVKVAGTLTRTLDIPVPWTILQVPATLPSAGTAPVPDSFVDPKSGANVVFDTYYSLHPGVPGNVLTNGGNQLGYFTYNPDYAYWLFWGNVVKATDGNSFDPNPPVGFNDDRGQAPPGGVFAAGAGTFSGPPYNGTYPAGGGFIIPGVYDPSKGSSTTPSTTVWSQGTTFNNGIPVGTRSQFLKKAVLTTWLSKQSSVLWAYRFLDNNNETNGGLNSANFTSGERVLTQFVSVNSGIHTSVQAIQEKYPADRTPLTAALANAYAQMVESAVFTSGRLATTGSIFDVDHTGLADTPCSSSFVVIFTDGMANDNSIGSGEAAPNAATLGTVNTEAQIQAMSYSLLDSGKTNYNIWSLAAVAAHGLPRTLDPTNAKQQTTGTGLPSTYAPFRVMTRGASAPGRKITTMTVGLSLAGSNTTGVSAGGKGPLLRTALYGDPKVTAFDLSNSVSGSSQVMPTGSGIRTNFFDATDPDSLIGALKDIIARITQANTSIVAPAAPLVGLNLGTRVYLGRFASTNAGAGSGSVWQGDLLMAGLGIQPDGTVSLIDKGGSFQSDINASNAVASASASLQAMGWKNRKVYTAVPGTTTLVPFADTNTAVLTPKVMGVSSDAEAQSLIRFIRGASLAAQSDTTNATSRADIMGDIINSSPTAVEYDPALLAGAGSQVLSDFWSAHGAEPTARFQVIFVGDNQGHFHAFGEVSYIDYSVKTTTGVLNAALDELWSFIPSELLNSPLVTTTIPKLSLLQASGRDHIYTTDGSPYIYFKDNPASGSSLGNRRVGSTDVIRVIFGMRKGGRSYYALDVVNPGLPVLSWVLDPGTSSDPAIKTMGLATSTPSVARVETGSSPSVVVKDLLILGGGYSNNEMDALTIGKNAAPAKLGRSLLALEVTTGTPVKIYDFVNNATLLGSFPNMGAISAGGFPFEFFIGSKKAQRVYFGDRSGGVYALGSMQTLATAPVGWRFDSSNIDEWTTDGTANDSSTPGNAGIRWIYKGATTVATPKVTAASPISSIPVAYRIPTAIPEFRRPATSANAPNMIPPVVGVTFGTGDRNDPMDAGPIKPVAANPLRQVMVFDRQDSADLPGGTLPSNVNTSAGAITDAQLSDQTGTIAPGTTSYLGNNQYLGYYLKFHTITDTADKNHTFFEKSYLNSVVVNGALLFSTFKPGRTGSTTICEGAGNTLTFRMCDALAPVFFGGIVPVASTVADKLDTGCNGIIFTWTNLAGDLTAIGSRMLLQSGQDTPVAGGGAVSSNVKIQDLVVKSGTQTFAPRAWRIIR